MLTELRPSFTWTRARSGAVGVDLEQADRALFLAERRPAHEQHVVQPFELDGAVDAQVGHGASRQLAVERDVDRARAVLHRRIDADHAARRRRRCACRSSAVWPIWMSLACVSAILISAFSRPGIGDARQVRARRHLLADFDRHELQHAGRVRRAPSARRAAAVAAAARRAPDRRATAAPRAAPGSTRRGWRAAPSRSRCRTASCSASTCDCLQHQIGDQLVLRQRLVHLGLHLRLVVVGLDVGRRRALLQQIVLHLHPEVGQRRLRPPAACSSASCSSWSSCGLVSSRMTLSAFTVVPGRRMISFHAPLRRRRNPADVFRHQRAEAAHLPDHRPALHRIGPERRGFDRRRRRLQPREADRDEADGRRGRRPRKSPG